MRPKELQEDIEWLEELHVMLTRLKQQNRSTQEVEEEIQKTLTKIGTHDYAQLEARRRESIKRFGKESIYY